MAEGKVVNLHTCKSYPQKGFCFSSIKRDPGRGNLCHNGELGEGGTKRNNGWALPVFNSLQQGYVKVDSLMLIECPVLSGLQLR